MKNIIPYRLFEANSDYSLPDYAWLHMLLDVYEGKMKFSSWAHDERMGYGSTAENSFRKFDCVDITDEFFLINDYEEAEKVLDSVFGTKSYEDAVRIVTGKLFSAVEP